MKSKKIKEHINNFNIYSSKMIAELNAIKDYIVFDNEDDTKRLGIFISPDDGEIYLSLDGKILSLESAVYYMETFGYVRSNEFY